MRIRLNERDVEHRSLAVAPRLDVCIQHQLHDTLECSHVAANTNLAVLACDPCLAKGYHLDGVLRCLKSLKGTLAQWVDHHDRHPSARRLVQFGHHPRAVGAGVLADHEDSLCMIE